MIYVKQFFVSCCDYIIPHPALYCNNSKITVIIQNGICTPLFDYIFPTSVKRLFLNDYGTVSI
ncbi:MAG TPA: hypothetical protein DCZ71_07135 [Ruminococcus sp.]|nr:hypothetical protein [Ruminococcus sp.]